MSKPKKVLFVCTGNICRSPTAHAIARNKAEILNKSSDFYFDSAGTDAYHVGEKPDQRSQQIGLERGISFKGIQARKIENEDFEKFDLIFAMDRSHLRKLKNFSQPQYHHKIQLFLEHYSPEIVPEKFIFNEVIDPYYSSLKEFNEVFDVLDSALNLFFEKN